MNKMVWVKINTDIEILQELLGLNIKSNGLSDSLLASYKAASSPKITLCL